MKVGFIGLGIMGHAMAANLQKHGHDLVLYNRSSEKGDDLVKGGATMVASPKQVGAESQIVLTMLSTPAVAEEVAFGENGFIQAMPTGALWVNSTTINPSFGQQLAAKARCRAIRYVDAPVAGSLRVAQTATLTFLVGAETGDFEAVRPLLECMGSRIIHVGEAGKGSAMKLVVNLMLGHAMVAFSEALILGEAEGLSKESLFSTILGGPTAAPVLSMKKEKIETEEFSPEFPLEWMHKDLFLMMQTAYETGVSLPATSAVKEIFGCAKAYGLGRSDFSAVYQFIRGAAGRP